jgi:methyl-accepting chemotaxis protein WspA
VANEIRRLADQTAVATLEIEEMIVEMQTAIKNGVASVENYTNQTKISSEKSARTSDELSEIIRHTQELCPQFEVVNKGMQMQSQSAAQISNAMQQLNETAHQTRDSLVEFRKITEQLNKAVQDLQKVERFSNNS